MEFFIAVIIVVQVATIAYIMVLRESVKDHERYTNDLYRMVKNLTVESFEHKGIDMTPQMRVMIGLMVYREKLQC